MLKEVLQVYKLCRVQSYNKYCFKIRVFAKHKGKILLIASILLFKSSENKIIADCFHFLSIHVSLYNGTLSIEFQLCIVMTNHVPIF